MIDKLIKIVKDIKTRRELNEINKIRKLGTQPYHYYIDAEKIKFSSKGKNYVMMNK